MATLTREEADRESDDEREPIARRAEPMHVHVQRPRFVPTPAQMQPRNHDPRQVARALPDIHDALRGSRSLQHVASTEAPAATPTRAAVAVPPPAFPVFLEAESARTADGESTRENYPVEAEAEAEAEVEAEAEAVVEAEAEAEADEDDFIILNEDGNEATGSLARVVSPYTREPGAQEGGIAGVLAAETVVELAADFVLAGYSNSWSTFVKHVSIPPGPPPPSAFATLVQHFRTACGALAACERRIQSLQSNVDKIADSVWTVGSTSLQQSRRVPAEQVETVLTKVTRSVLTGARDRAVSAITKKPPAPAAPRFAQVTATTERRTASFQDGRKEQLAESLQTLHEVQSEELVSCVFRVAHRRLLVDDHIRRVLAACDAANASHSLVDMGPARQCLDVLFGALRHPAAEGPDHHLGVEEIEAWILHIGAALLAKGRFQDRAYLLMHVRALDPEPGHSSWMVPLVQLVGHAQPAPDAPASAPPSLDSASAEVAFAVSPAPMRSVFTNDDIEAYIALLGLLVLSHPRPSDHYLRALFDQCPHAQVIESMLPDSISMLEVSVRSGPDIRAAIRRTFGRVAAVVELIGKAIAMHAKSSPSFVQRAVQFLIVLVDRTAWFATHVCEDGNYHLAAQEPAQVQVKHLLDVVCLSAARQVMVSPVLQARALLRDLPLSALMPESAWRLLAALVLDYTGPEVALAIEYRAPGSAVPSHSGGASAGKITAQELTWELRKPAAQTFLRDESDYGGVRRAIFLKTARVHSLRSWLALVKEDPMVRWAFVNSLEWGDIAPHPKRDASGPRTSEVHEAGAHRLGTLARLAASCGGELANVVVRELIGVGVLCESTQEAYLAHAAEGLRIICKAHPRLISLVVHIVALNSHVGAHVGQNTWDLFRTLPISLWRPNGEMDVRFIRDWLQRSEADPLCKVAMWVIQSLDWAALSAELHVKFAVLLALAHVAHQSHNSPVVKEETGHALVFGAPSPHPSEATDITGRPEQPVARGKRAPASQYAAKEDPLPPFDEWCWSRVANVSAGIGQVPRVDMHTSSLDSQIELLRLAWQDAEKADPSTLDPLLAFVVGIVTNSIEQDGWAPLTVLVAHRRFDAVVRLLRELHVLLVPRAGDVDASLGCTPGPLPHPSTWLLPLLAHAVEAGPKSAERARPLSRSTDASSDREPTDATHASSAASPVCGISRFLPASWPFAFGRLLTLSPFVPEGSSIAAMLASELSKLKEDGPERQAERASAIVGFWLRQVLLIDSWNENVGCKRFLDELLGLSRALPCRAAVMETVHRVLNKAYAEALAAEDQALRSDPSRREVVTSPPTILRPELASTLALSVSSVGRLLGTAPPALGATTSCTSLAFACMVAETLHELPLWLSFGRAWAGLDVSVSELLVSLPDVLPLYGLPREPTKLLAWGHVGRPHSAADALAQFRLVRWADFCLSLSSREPLLILFWQVFVSLYFSRVLHPEDQTQVVFFGHVLFEHPAASHVPAQLAARAKALAEIFNRDAMVSRSEGASDEEMDRLLELASVMAALAMWLEPKSPASWLSTAVASQASQEAFNLPNLCPARLNAVLNSPLFEPGDADDNGANAHASLHLEHDRLWLELVPHMALSLPVARENSSATSGAHISAPARRPVPDSLPRSRPCALARDLFLEPIDAPVYSRLPALLPKPDVEASLTDGQALPWDMKESFFSAMHSLSGLYVHSVRAVHKYQAMYLSELPRLYHAVPSERTVIVTRAGNEFEFHFEFDEDVVDTSTARTLSDALAHIDRNMAHLKLTFRGYGFTLWTGNEVDGDQVTRSTGNASMEPAEGLVVNALIGVSVTEDLCDQLATLATVRAGQNASPDKPELRATSASERIDSANEQLGSVPARAQRHGEQLVRDLLALETKAVRTCPPLRDVVWELIARAAKVFARGHEGLTFEILRCMVQDPARIPLLAPVFLPDHTLASTMKLYRCLYGALGLLKPTDSLRILSRFDFRGFFDSYVSKRPPAEQREIVHESLTLMLGLLRVEPPPARCDAGEDPELCDDPVEGASTPGDAVRGAGNPPVAEPFEKDAPRGLDPAVRSFHRRVVRLILLHNGLFCEHFATVLQLLMGLAPESQGRPCLADVWNDILELDPSTAWARLRVPEVENACTLVSAVLRDSHEVVAGYHKVDLVEPWCALVHKVLDSVLAKHGEDGLDAVAVGWRILISLLGSCLLVQPREDPGNVMLACFVKCARLLAGRGGEQVMQWAWTYWNESLRASCDARVHRALLELPWELWSVGSAQTLVVLERIVETCEPTDPGRGFVLTVFTRLNWAKSFVSLLEGGALPSALDPGAPVARVLRMLLHLVAQHPLPMPQSIVHFVSGVAGPMFPWLSLSANSYSILLSECVSMLNRSIVEGKDKDLAHAKPGTTTASGSGSPVVTPEVRALVVVRLMAHAVGLSLLGPSDGPAAMSNAVQKACMYVAFLRHWLVGAMGQVHTVQEASVADPKQGTGWNVLWFGSSGGDGGRGENGKSSEERLRLSFSPASFVLLLFEALRDVHGALELLEDRSDATLQAEGDAADIWTEFVAFLNVPGVVLAKPPCEVGIHVASPGSAASPATNAVRNAGTALYGLLTSLVVAPGSVVETETGEWKLEEWLQTAPGAQAGALGLTWKRVWAAVKPAMVQAVEQGRSVTGAGIGGLAYLYLSRSPAESHVPKFWDEVLVVGATRLSHIDVMATFLERAAETCLLGRGRRGWDAIVAAVSSVELRDSLIREGLQQSAFLVLRACVEAQMREAAARGSTGEREALATLVRWFGSGSLSVEPGSTAESKLFALVELAVLLQVSPPARPVQLAIIGGRLDRLADATQYGLVNSVLDLGGGIVESLSVQVPTPQCRLACRAMAAYLGDGETTKLAALQDHAAIVRAGLSEDVRWAVRVVSGVERAESGATAGALGGGSEGAVSFLRSLCERCWPESRYLWAA